MAKTRAESNVKALGRSAWPVTSIEGDRGNVPCVIAEQYRWQMTPGRSVNNVMGAGGRSTKKSERNVRDQCLALIMSKRLGRNRRSDVLGHPVHWPGKVSSRLLPWRAVGGCAFAARGITREFGCFINFWGQETTFYSFSIFAISTSLKLAGCLQGSFRSSNAHVITPSTIWLEVRFFLFHLWISASYSKWALGWSKKISVYFNYSPSTAVVISNFSYAALLVGGR